MGGRLEDGANKVVRGTAGKAEPDECALPFHRKLKQPTAYLSAVWFLPPTCCSGCYDCFGLQRGKKKHVRCCP